MRSIPFFLVAAVAEIAGCYAFWAWLRAGRSPLWAVPGTLALAVFAVALARTETATAGRAFAAYAGVYLAASLGWLWAVEGVRPDRWDALGAALALAGSALILLAPRHP